MNTTFFMNKHGEVDTYENWVGYFDNDDLDGFIQVENVNGDWVELRGSSETSIVTRHKNKKLEALTQQDKQFLRTVLKVLLQSEQAWLTPLKQNVAHYWEKSNKEQAETSPFFHALNTNKRVLRNVKKRVAKLSAIQRKLKG